jgi:glucan 1,3-beta-glucosidase
MFFTSNDNRKHTIHILHVLLASLLAFPRRMPNIIGIELLNEPSPPPASHTILKEWYRSTITELRSLDPYIPLYIGDCWRTDEYAEFIDSLSGADGEDKSLVVLDHHLYRCFTASDINTPADAHSRALSNPGAPTPQTFARVAEKLSRARCGSGLVVGEWSGALNPGSMTGKVGEMKAYVDAQLGLYEKTCGGWFFWTFRKQEDGDSGWSFRDAVKTGSFPNFIGLKVKEGASMGTNQECERRAKVRDAERNHAIGTFSITLLLTFVHCV